MKINLKDTSIQILFKIVIVILAGLFLVSKSIISLNDSLFSYTVFGVSVILFYHTIKTFGFKDFILPALIYSAIVTLSLMNITLVSSFFRNILLFIILGAICYSGIVFENKLKGIIKYPAVFGFWLIGLLLFYFCLSFFNAYIFGLYIFGPEESFMQYCLSQLYMGAILGSSIGLGMIIPKDIIINKR